MSTLCLLSVTKASRLSYLIQSTNLGTSRLLYLIQSTNLGTSHYPILYSRLRVIPETYVTESHIYSRLGRWVSRLIKLKFAYISRLSQSLMLRNLYSFNMQIFILTILTHLLNIKLDSPFGHLRLNLVPSSYTLFNKYSPLRSPPVQPGPFLLYIIVIFFPSVTSGSTRYLPPNMQ